MAKDSKDKRSIFVDSWEEQNLAEVCLQQRTWFPQLEVNAATILWNASVREFQRGHSTYIAEALEQPFLFPKDIDAMRKLKQQDLLMPLKMDLAMVSSQLHTFYLLSTNQFFLSLLFTWGCYIVFVQIT